MRKTERFKKVVGDLGFVDYWRARLAGAVPSGRYERLRLRLNLRGSYLASAIRTSVAHRV